MLYPLPDFDIKTRAAVQPAPTVQLQTVHSWANKSVRMSWEEINVQYVQVSQSVNKKTCS